MKKKEVFCISCERYTRNGICPCIDYAKFHELEKKEEEEMTPPKDFNIFDDGVGK